MCGVDVWDEVYRENGSLCPAKAAKSHFFWTYHGVVQGAQGNYSEGEVKSRQVIILPNGEFMTS